MKVKRCSKCNKVKEITFNRGEQPAQFVEMCKCKEVKEKWKLMAYLEELNR